jgi:serine/threonine protein kinase
LTLQNPQPSSSFSAEQGDPEQSPELELTGSTLHGRYQVDAQLGKGGMGTVYRATDLRLTRQVALKVLAPELVAHPTARRRMAQEANALARIEHPNVVRVLDVFDHGALMVLVLELVTGGDLAGRIRRSALPPAEATAMLAGILHGLAAIHAANLVHRDIKPDNVLLSASQVPKLTDLGVARDALATQKTQLGARIGTPEYMSPEQAQGVPVDLRSDLYSVGLVFYEMLTAKLPFAGSTELDLLAARVQRDPDLTALPHDGTQFYAFLAKALARSPDQRFANAAEMLDALQHPSQVSAPPPSLDPAPQPVSPAPAAFGAPIAASAHPAPPSPATSAGKAPAKSSALGAMVGLAVVAMAALVGFAAFAGKSSTGASESNGESGSSGGSPGASGSGSQPQAAAQADEMPAFVAAQDSCKWTTSTQASWLERGRESSFTLRAAVKTPYYSVQATRPTVASGKASEMVITGKQGSERVVVSGFELLTIKTFAPSLDVEWVIGFWAANNNQVTDGPNEGVQEAFSGRSAATVTRITASGVETKVIRFDPDDATDENDGHFMHIRYEPDQSTSDCTLRLATNNGEFRGKGVAGGPKLSRRMTLPSSPESWPSDLGGEWSSVGGFLSSL